MLDFILSLFQGFLLLKFGFLVANIFFIVFLVVVYKQQKAMQRVVYDNGASTLVDTVALISILVALSLFGAALVIL